jgi:Cu2+-exporting ATPase
LTTLPSATSVISRNGELAITDPALFLPGQEARAQLFTRRILRVPEMRRLEIDPARATATLRYRAPLFGAADVIRRLADAAASGDPLSPDDLPLWPPDGPVTVYCHAGLVSTLEILSVGHESLRTCHTAMKRPSVARAMQQALRDSPGIREATVTAATATLGVKFAADITDARALVRLAEAVLRAQARQPAVTEPDLPGFTMPNIALGVSVVGEVVAPVQSVAAALLVLTNIGALRAGAKELRDGRLSLPVLYSSLMVFTILSSSYLPAAVMFWFLRYWERRHLIDTAEENAALLGELPRVPERARMITAVDGERWVPSAVIEAGQRVRVLAGETIPVDGRVASVSALIEESLLGGGVQRAVRVRGDDVFAGATVRVGQLDLTVRRSGRWTRAARITRAVHAAAVPRPSLWTLTAEAEAFAARAVPPTLAVAALGMVVGGAAPATSVLRADYATGIGLAAPLRALRLTRLALRRGALVRTAALDRLAHAQWVVLDDHETLCQRECELAELQVSRIAENQLLPAVAAAGACLGDERGPALVRACAARGLVARQAELRSVDETGVSINYGAHVVRLAGQGDRASLPALRVDVDGFEAAWLKFRRSGQVPAAATVRELRRRGLRVLLASRRSSEEAARRARHIGADAHAGGLDDQQELNLLRALHARGVAVVHVRNGPALAHVADDYVSLALAGPDGVSDDADVALLGRSIAQLPVLMALARDSVAQSEWDRWTMTAPNVAAVASVLALGFPGITVVLTSTLATYIANDCAKKLLAEARANPFADAELAAPAAETVDMLQHAVPCDSSAFERPRAIA